MAKRLDPGQEREARRLADKGHSLREIGRLVGCSRHGVANALVRQPASPAKDWNPSPARLSLAEREEIRVGPGAG